MTSEERRARSTERTRLWRERNKDRVPTPEQRAAHNERNRRYRERHPETIKRIVTESNNKRRAERAVWAKKRYENRTEEERQAENLRSKLRQREWAKANRELTRVRSSQYYWTNRDTISARGKEPSVRAEKAAYIRHRKRTDASYRLISNLRTRLYGVLKRTGNRRSARTLDLVGCSIVELRRHLEQRFKPGMSWANYGKWHVDHIRPCASFDLADPIQQHECFHFSNLQPLWAQENHMKSKRITA